ncbi:MAG: tRNA (N6-isopentenyl adenosine(37)-C2)-methylthiotransferase MiaB [Deltaproteobacteria bacterium]|nr:tRNA (N6-isopentenyl adenosine(37)-C2)-methylthiotransferase MiaB [Deltaproteobacteria bacterium]
MSKLLYINTFGCQMNVYDSERIEGSLKKLGYTVTSLLESADLVIANTCAIRAKAEQKAFSFLGRLAKIKRKKPELIVGVGGCVAQQQGREILRRMPHVDLVFGTHALGRLSSAVQKIEKNRCRIVDIDMSETVADEKAAPAGLPAEGIAKFVTIMQGCDNYCSYCVVPHVRGREASRHPDDILNEIKMLVDGGVKEVTLLGQNVNSYGIKEGLCSFAGLLSMINRVNGLSRIRFTTSHPKDLSDDLIEAFGDLEKLCRHIHLPVQSGSNRVLKRMNRKYTREAYMQKVRRLRARCPQIAITSDIIVGFPGETTTDAEDTLDLMRRVRFDSLFAFNYSDRPSAPSRKFSGKVAAHEKNERLQRVLAAQAVITADIHAGMVGKTEPVLIEGYSKLQETEKGKPTGEGRQWSGRTSCNKIVNFDIDGPGRTTGDVIGRTVPIKIEKALSHSLWGTWCRDADTGPTTKGENCYAA